MNQQDRFRVFLMRAMHSFYKLIVSPVLHAGAGMTGGACRFQPTCSEYGTIAIHEYGWFRGGWLALKRISRCHPGSRVGFDPVPPKRSFMQSSPAPVTIKEAHISYESRS